MSSFVVFADGHVDTPLNAVFDVKNGTSSNTIEALDALTRVVDYCNNNQIDYLVSAGDLLDDGVTHPDILIRLLQVFDRLESTKVIFLVGNHEYRGLKAQQALPYTVFTGSPWLHSIIDTETLLDLDDVQVGLIPWATQLGSHTKKIPTIAEREQNLVSRVDPSRPAILIGHGTITDATFQVSRDGSPVTMKDMGMAHKSTNSIDDQDFSNIWDYIGYGHIHLRQTLGKSHYIGPLYRFTHGDTNTPVGFDVVRVQNGCVTENYVEFKDTRRFYQITVDEIDTIEPNSHDVIKVTVPYNRELSRAEKTTLEDWKQNVGSISIINMPAPHKRVVAATSTGIEFSRPDRELDDYLKLKKMAPGKRDRIVHYFAESTGVA